MTRGEWKRFQRFIKDMPNRPRMCLMYIWLHSPEAERIAGLATELEAKLAKLVVRADGAQALRAQICEYRAAASRLSKSILVIRPSKEKICFTGDDVHWKGVSLLRSEIKKVRAWWTDYDGTIHYFSKV